MWMPTTRPFDTPLMIDSFLKGQPILFQKWYNQIDLLKKLSNEKGGSRLCKNKGVTSNHMINTLW